MKLTKKRLLALPPEMDAELIKLAKENPSIKSVSELIRIILGRFIKHMKKKKGSDK